MAEFRKRWLEIALLVLAILAITALHYATGAIHQPFHDVYRRLYYVPIIIAAFRFGMAGALAASIFTSIVYIPHGFFFAPNIDPQDTPDKVLEVVLYNLVALVTGWLVEQLKAEARRHRKTAEELRETLDRVEKIQYRLRVNERLAAIGQLTAGLAHEIRNPLSSIQGTAEICSDEFPPEHPKHEMAQVLLKETARLNEILTQFLDFARPRELQRRKAEVCEELRSVADLLRRRSAENDHDISLRLEGSDHSVNADMVKLRQVFLNLGLNAVEAMPNGGKLEISAGKVERKDGNYVTIEFRDSGEGMERDVMEKIFNPFFTTKPGGTGLGLAISHRIVEDHGGRIEVDSSPGQDSTFTILIPEWSADETADSDS